MSNLYKFVRKTINSYFIIFLTSLTSIGFEIVITRYFSIIFSHHYIFLSISLALLGYGLGGIVASLFNLQKENMKSIIMLYGLSYLFPIFLPQYLPVFLTHPILLATTYLFPFLFSGIIVSVFYKTQFLPPLVYFYDLSGAGLGVLTSIFLLDKFDPINIIIIFMIIIFLLLVGVHRNVFGLIGSIAMMFFFVINISYGFINVPFAKLPPNANIKVMVQLLRKTTTAKIEKTYWSANFRTDVISYTNNQQTKCIFVDGGAPTMMFNAQDGFTNLIWLRNTINYLPLLFVSNEDFLSIGPGGGLDIILANLAEFKRIEAVEINHSILKILSDYKNYNGNILEIPCLGFRIGEGRSFLARSDREYDLIFLSLSLTNTSATTGTPYAESYLHTIEAYINYYRHLKENGMVALFCETYPFLLRSILTMTIALNKSGVDIENTYKHLVIISNFLPESPYKYLVMFNKNQITHSQAQMIQQEATHRNLNIEFLPYVNEEMPIKFGNSQEINDYRNQIKKSLHIDITPVADEKPFFGDFSTKPHISYILLCILSAICAISVLCFLKRKGSYLLVSTFYLLGTGFMMVEITLIQKCIFFLGSQTLAFCITLFSFLVSCSLGGLLTNHLKRSTILILLPAILFFQFLFLNDILIAFARLHDLFKLLFTIVIVCILGCLMGMFFPILITLAKQKTKFDIGVIFGINGIMSVFGSTLAMIIAREFGYKYNLLIATFLYLIVSVILSKLEN